jgi:hypothetical protein
MLSRHSAQGVLGEEQLVLRAVDEPERHEGELIVLAFFAAALAASAPVPAASTPVPRLEAAVPWWERITVTVDDKGTQQSCKYQSSLSAKGAETCDEAMASTMPTRKAEGGTGAFAKLTFERRFSPGGKLDNGPLQTGDQLLGQQVMFLTIDVDGSIQSCRIVGTSGDMLPAYGCEQAKSEQFRVEASAPSDAPRQAFMTIRVFGHQEQIV